MLEHLGGNWFAVQELNLSYHHMAILPLTGFPFCSSLYLSSSTATQEISKKDEFTSPLIMVSYVQVSFLRNALIQLPLLFIHIFQHQRDRADVAVQEIKKKFKENLVDHDSRAREVQEVLEEMRATTETRAGWLKDWRFHVIVFLWLVSAVLLLIGMGDLSFRKEHKARLVLFGDDWFWRVRSPVAAAIMAVGWFRFAMMALQVAVAYRQNLGCC